MASFGVSPLDPERRRLERRRALVDILQKQAMANPQAPTMPGAQMSPYQGLAKMGEALIAALANRAQEKREQAFAVKEKEEAKNQAQSVVDYLMPSEFKPPAAGEQLSPTITSAIPSQLNLTTPMRPIPQNVQQAQMANAIVTPQVPEPVAPPAPPSQEPQASPYTRNMASALANYAQNQGQRQAFTNALATGGPLAGVMMQDIMNKRKLQSDYEQQKRLKELSTDYEVLGQGQQLINPKTGEVVARNVAPVKTESPIENLDASDYTPSSLQQFNDIFANTGRKDYSVLKPVQPEISAADRPITQEQANAINAQTQAVVLRAGGTIKDAQNFLINPGQPYKFVKDTQDSVGRWINAFRIRAQGEANKAKTASRLPTSTPSYLVSAAANVATQLTGDQTDRFYDALSRHVNEKDYLSAQEFAYNSLMNSKNITGSVKQNHTALKSIVSKLNKINELMQDPDVSGKTGLLEGTIQNLYNAAGKARDPKLSKLSSEINNVLIEYRRQMTGAAFSQAEKAEYENLFPSTQKEDKLNVIKLNSLLDSMKNKLYTSIAEYLGEEFAGNFVNDKAPSTEQPPPGLNAEELKWWHKIHKQTRGPK